MVKYLVSTLITSVLVVFGTLNMTSNAFAQGTGQPGAAAPTSSTPTTSNNATTTSATTNTTNTTSAQALLDAIQFTHYIDPSGRFELDYPSDWTLYEEDDNQDDVDVAWNTVNSSSTPTSLVFTIALPPEPVPSGYTLEQVVGLFREMELSIRNVTSSVPKPDGTNTTTTTTYYISQPSLTNYTITGQPAASYDVKRNTSGEQIEEIASQPDYHKLHVISIFNNKGFLLEFTMNQADYPTLLPVIDRIIESIIVTNL
jgi:hypothetical protein